MRPLISLVVFMLASGCSGMDQVSDNKNNILEDRKKQIVLVLHELWQHSSKIEGRPPIHSSQSKVTEHLGSELIARLKTLEKTYDVIWNLHDVAKEKKVELPEEYILSDGNITKDLIFFQTCLFRNTLKIGHITLGEAEAEIEALQEQPGDEDQKVWVKSRRQLSIYFAFDDGAWKLREIVFKDPENSRYLCTLTRMLELKSLDNQKVIKVWSAVLTNR